MVITSAFHSGDPSSSLGAGTVFWTIHSKEQYPSLNSATIVLYKRFRSGGFLVEVGTVDFGRSDVVLISMIHLLRGD